MRRRLDNEVGPDQLVAVVDARGASALQVTRKVTHIKETALALNQVRPSSISLHCVVKSVDPWLRRDRRLQCNHAKTSLAQFIG